jgi:hypothetical protein
MGRPEQKWRTSEIHCSERVRTDREHVSRGLA